MKRILLLMTILIPFHGCKYDAVTQSSSLCDVKNPVEELKWLGDVINSKTDCKIYDGSSLYAYTYNSRTIFYMLNPAISLGACTELAYDCQGNKLFSTTDEWKDFKAKRTDERFLWKK